MREMPLTLDLATPATLLWNRCLGPQFPMRTELLKQNLWAEPNFDPEGSRAVLDGDRLIGLVAVKRQQVDLGVQKAENRGWITAILVDPAYQGRGIGSGLLQGARGHLRQYSAAEVALGSDPGHLFPGIPFECRQALDWFSRRGARLGGPVCDLANDALADYRHGPEAVEAFARSRGVQYRPASERDLPALRTFLQTAFPGRWAWEIEQHIARGGRPEDLMIAVDGAAGEGQAVEGPAVVGFARIHGPESTLFGPAIYWSPLFPGRHGGLGPIGVGKEQRGRGIGLALLAASIAELRDRGITSGVIDWTDLVPFYGLVGFRPWKWYTTARLPA